MDLHLSCEENPLLTTARNATILHLESENARLRAEAASARNEAEAARHEAEEARHEAAEQRVRYEQSLQELVQVIEQVRGAKRGEEEVEEDFAELETAARLASMSAGTLDGMTSVPVGAMLSPSTTNTTNMERDGETGLRRWLSGNTDVPSTQATSPPPIVKEEEDEEEEEGYASGNTNHSMNIATPVSPPLRGIRGSQSLYTKNARPSQFRAPRRRKRAASLTRSQSPVHGTRRARRRRTRGDGDYVDSHEDRSTDAMEEADYISADERATSKHVDHAQVEKPDNVASQGMQDSNLDYALASEPRPTLETIRSNAPSPTPSSNSFSHHSHQPSTTSTTLTPRTSRYSHPRQTTRRFAVGTVPNIHFEFTRKARTVSEIYREWHVGTARNPPIAHLERAYGTAWRSDPGDKAAMKYSSNYVSVRRMVIEFVDREVERRVAVGGGRGIASAEEVCGMLDGVVRGRIQGLTECLRAKADPFEVFGKRARGV